MDKSIPKSQFGIIVRERIKQYGYKEYEFADMIGIHRSSLSRYIKGDSLPDYRTAIVICNALNLDIYKVDTMDIKDLEKDTEKIFNLRNEFEKLGIISEGQDLSQKQLDLLRGLIINNKGVFQLVDKLVSADTSLVTSIISGVASNPVKND